MTRSVQHALSPAPTADLSRRGLLAAGAAAASLALTATPGVAWAAPPGGAPAGFGPVTLYRPPAGSPAPGALYARATRLHCAPRRRGGPAPLLATFEQYVTTRPSFPVFRSDDEGRTWSQISAVTDTVNGWGLRYQPFLYELPRPFAGLPRGTVLCAGNSIPDDLSQTKLDLYASTDAGRSWRFVGSVARGGRAVPNNGETPVWEPFLLLHHDRLVCWYSDQRDPRYGQKLVHQTSTDLRTWSPVVDDVTNAEYLQRPGMPTVAALPDGRWIMTYEGGVTTGDGLPFFSVHYKIASSPLAFGVAPQQLLRDTTGHVPMSSPTVTWTPAGGARGTVVVSAGSDQDLFLNRRLGAPGAWTRQPSVVPAGYARFSVPLDGPRVFTISGGPVGVTSLNSVTDGVDVLAGS